MVDDLFPLTLTGAEVSRRGKRLLGPVNMTLPRGGFTAIIGPNGAGKTTLLRIMHGVERISNGTADWAIDAVTARTRQAYVFQQPIMLRRTVAENLAYPLRLIGMPKPARAQAVSEWAARIGLTASLQTPGTRLSGGERQKLALGRALIRDPDVLFLDEPCANLDGPATREIEALLQATHAAGTTIFLVTHDMGQVRRLATDVMLLVGGVVVEIGSVDPTMSAPQTAELKAFLNGEILT
jgi:tungstate transport system ATP-binding protein